MSFDRDAKKLYDCRSAYNVLMWDSSIHSNPSLENGVLYVLGEYNKLLKRFIKKYPNATISKVYKSETAIPNSLMLAKEKCNIRLSAKYQELKKSQQSPDKEYFKLLNQNIDLYKKCEVSKGNLIIEGKNISGDDNIGSYDIVFDTIEKMVNINKKFLKESREIRPDKKIIPLRYFSYDNLNELANSIPGVYGIISNNNGSFMMSINSSSSRIHIMDRGILEKDKMASSIYHELGHSLYQNHILCKNTAIGKFGGAVSLSLHESCSILFELALANQNNVVDSTARHNLKRLFSDKIHYVFHIYIRMLIEKELLSGDLAVTDIEKRWNSLMEEYIGLTPETPWEGFMQDIHWNVGSFGYFHSYALGFLNACYMFEEINDELKDNDDNHNIFSVLLPLIERKFGSYNENSENILEDLLKKNPNIFNVYEHFLYSNFYLLDKEQTGKDYDH